MKAFKLSSLRAAALLAAGFSSVMFYSEVASAFVIYGYANKCLDVRGAATADNTPIVLATCNGGANNQQWRFVSDGTIRSLQSGKCLDAVGQGVANGTAIVLASCNGGNNQKWSLETNGTIRGLGSGRCLDVRGGSTANGTPINLFTCQGALNQTWSFLTLGL